MYFFQCHLCRFRSVIFISDAEPFCACRIFCQLGHFCLCRYFFQFASVDRYIHAVFTASGKCIRQIGSGHDMEQCASLACAHIDQSYDHFHACLLCRFFHCRFLICRIFRKIKRLFLCSERIGCDRDPIHDFLRICQKHFQKNACRVCIIQRSDNPQFFLFFLAFFHRTDKTFGKQLFFQSVFFKSGCFDLFQDFFSAQFHCTFQSTHSLRLLILCKIAPKSRS